MQAEQSIVVSEAGGCQGLPWTEWKMRVKKAPSDHPEFAEFLVECGIDSISVVPDSFISVKNHVAEAESRRN